jgi:integrase/recombinase XerD
VSDSSDTRDIGDTSSPETQRAELAAAFGRDLDPLAEFAPTFETTDIDPFALFTAEVLDGRNITSDTRAHYQREFRQWREHMAREGRHPACPNEGHVKTFARYERDEKGNHPRTVKKKLRRLKSVYEHWQNDPGFPHPTDYNPFALALEKLDFDGPKPKEPPRIPINELSNIIDGVTNARTRALIVTQLKLGLRCGEVSNIELRDVNLQNAELQKHYPELGANPRLGDRENAIYIPPRNERDGNKSQRPRVLPLDDEMRRVLLRYLLIRPDAGTPWLFLSETNHDQLLQHGINSAWKDAFHPEYAGTDEHRKITSHYGRHRFTSYWRVEQDAPRELVKYMRGDVAGGHNEGIDHYIHTYYEDIEPLYRDQIFKLGV